MKLTPDEVRELLHYDPHTGEFRWIKARRGVRVGDLCGRINGNGYLEIGLDGGLVSAARLAFYLMNDAWPDGEADHINRNRADNRWVNLREATRVQNSVNQNVRVSNTSGFRGVVWDRDRCLWRAQARVQGRKVNLGRFASAEDAAHAVDTAAAAGFGNFAVLNFPHANRAA